MSTQHIIVALVIIALIAGGYMYLHKSHIQAVNKTTTITGDTGVAGGHVVTPNETFIADPNSRPNGTLQVSGNA